LANVTNVVVDIDMNNSLSLPDINGLSGITVVGGNLSIQGNSALCASHVTTITGPIAVGGSTVLVNNTGTSCP